MFQMRKECRVKLDNVINELETFLERDFSSKFKNLTEKEDRQLFFLAKILVRLKHIKEEMKEDEKILIHPAMRREIE